MKVLPVDAVVATVDGMALSDIWMGGGYHVCGAYMRRRVKSIRRMYPARLSLMQWVGCM